MSSTSQDKPGDQPQALVRCDVCLQERDDPDGTVMHVTWGLLVHEQGKRGTEVFPTFIRWCGDNPSCRKGGARLVSQSKRLIEQSRAAGIDVDARMQEALQTALGQEDGR